MSHLQRMGLALAGLFALVWLAGNAGETAKHGFLDRVHKGADGTASKYVLFVPHDYKGDKEYPLILFLHGAGETGSDGKKQAKTGLGPAIKKQEKTFPCITIFPQAQKRGWQASGDEAKRALAIL